jgi:hypothetical protein
VAKEDIELRLKIDKLKADLAKIPGLTNAELNKMAAAAAKHWGKVEQAGKKAADSTGTALKKLAGGVGFGGLANDIDDLAGGLGMLGGTAGVTRWASPTW